VELGPVLISALVAIGFGGLAGAAYSNWQAGQRSKEATQRVRAVVSADVRLARNVIGHNATVAGFGVESAAYSFIRYPTRNYELLIFSGEIIVLSRWMLDPLMGYLQQVYHVNSMIEMFEKLRIEIAARPNTLLHGTMGSCLVGIKRYSEDISQVLDSLERALQEEEDNRGKEKLLAWWRLWLTKLTFKPDNL
jgi:hypothetical protein